MPTECERSVTSPVAVAEVKENSNGKNLNEDLSAHSIMENGNMSTSQTSVTSNGSGSCNGSRKTSITSPDPTAYVAKARVTRPTPPPPPYNPMQFVQIKPCNLYQTAQEQLKKAEEVKKIKEIRKEEPEDWQNNLDNWKSSRRKRVEHIIDRVVEVKKLELEEHDRTRRKSKTFSEMIEERGERGRGLNKLASLAVYAEDESNDLSDLGIGTSSASGKSSLSEDYDNNSVMSDNAAELDKAINNSIHQKPNNTESTTREYISSPGYETSSSTAPASSPDPCEYTYEGAIQDYKQRVSRAASGLTSVALNKLTSQQQHQQQNSKESTPERPHNKETAYPPRRGSKIEDRLMGFEVQSPSEECVEKNKVDVPKIDISKRKEIFEAQEIQNPEPKSQLVGNNAGVPRITLRDRFKVQETNGETLTEQPKKELRRLSGDITSIRERLQSLEQQHNLVNGIKSASKTTGNKLVDIPVPPLKERLSSLQNAVTKEEVRKPPVPLVDARQLEIMKSEEKKAQQTLKETKKELVTVKETAVVSEHIIENKPTQSVTQEEEEVDRDDSGIHTADDVELDVERAQADLMKKEQEVKLNAAIEALAKEEKQLSEAANAVNQIEAEFEELTLGSVSLPPLASNTNASATPITNDHMEYSVSSTNPQTNSTISINNISSNSPNTSSCSNYREKTPPNSLNDSNTVKGLVDVKKASNLRRKPTNEMVHAKNLLKIFKETFQNDIEFDEQEVSEGEHEIKNIKEKLGHDNKTDIIEAQTYDNSKDMTTSAAKTSPTAAAPVVGCSNSPTNKFPSYSTTASSIPRSMTPLGKPPMSPQFIRSNTKILVVTPPGSPSIVRKNDSQFSINGRVEIFNSKTMISSPNAANLMKPTTPVMARKKTQLPYINAPKTTQSNNIVLPIQYNQRQQQQLSQDETTKQQQKQQQKPTTTVIEPLSTTTSGTVTTRQNGKIEQLKSMPSQQMVNEPQTLKLDDRETKHCHQQQPAIHSNDAVKQQQQPEVVVCAPPITIVNPDELPKPNTVKTLSSCFQQQSTAPSPLPRSRIPQATPPPSPALPRRHKCYTPENGKVDNDKTSYLAAAQEKKWSTISGSSTSSASTGSTVIDNSKTLSILSNTSSTSEDVTPTIVQTNAQIHKEPQNDRGTLEVQASEFIKLEQNKLTDEHKEKNTDFETVKEESAKQAKVLDKQSTNALVEEMNKTDKQMRNLILKTEDVKSQTNEIRSLTHLKINVDMNDEVDKALNSQPTILKSPKPSSLPSNLPFTTPLAPLQSTERIPQNKQPNNQGTPLSSLKNTTPFETTSTIMKPAELPSLPPCTPNESTLYKLASSAPHSPVSPSTNSEKNLALDSALCNNLLTSLAIAPEIIKRQRSIEEDSCQKVEKNSQPFHQSNTGFKDVSKVDINRCEGISPTTTSKTENYTLQHRKPVEDELLQKLDIRLLPEGKQQPTTGYKSISPTEIRKCDNFFGIGLGKSNSESNSKPKSPILQAREAHSKALINTCEKIIAEERLASTQLKSSLTSSSPRGTPIPPRKSKIPKPIPSCCKAAESLNEADVSQTKEDNNGVIARMHVVETQIKVTTTTPPPSPKVIAKPIASPQPSKKTKNIFDFLKKNFGVSSHSHKEPNQEQLKLLEDSTDKKALVLTEEEVRDLERVNYDEIHTIDNSKFYVPSSDFDEEEATVPPPLPKTPAPVNIEITRKVITDEILEDGKTEKDLTKEIDDLLDDELNKLNNEIDKLEKAGKKD